MGEVIFIGGGSGDPGLVTVAGALALKKAQIVFYDRLINPLLLWLTNDQAQLVDVGKLPGSTIHGQVEISNQLLRAQKEYAIVARLKGGDPGVFGRLDEELTAIKQQHIPFRIIPGITSALALGAYSSISLTKRSVSRGITIITGHQVDETQSVLDHLIQNQTLIVYMGVHLIQAIQAKLLTQFPADLPVLIGQQVSFSQQRLVPTTLAQLAKTVATEAIKNPALFLFGDVAKDYDRAQNWLAQQPLLGQRWLMFTKQLNYEDILRYTELGADIWPISHDPKIRQKFQDLSQDWLRGPLPQGIILRDGLSKTDFQDLALMPPLEDLAYEDESTFLSKRGIF